MNSTPSGARWRIVHSEASMGWGGQERRVVLEMEGFRRLGADARLIADKDSGIWREARARGFETFRCSPKRHLHLTEFFRVRRWLLGFQPHVVNTHSSRDGWVVGLAARAARVPFIVRSKHFDVPISSPWLSRIVYARLADHVIATSPAIVTRMAAALSLPEAHFTTMPTGVDLGRFHPDGPQAALRELARIPAGVPLIGTVSILRRAKGHRHLIDALRLLLDSGRRLHCFIVGDGPVRQEIADHVRASNVGDHVTLMGNRDDVPEILRALDILLMPSLHEAIPQAVLQAFACGTPVIGSDVGGIPAIVRPGETGRLVPPGDAPALAEAISVALDQPEETRRLSTHARHLVATEHSLDRMVERLDALYRAHMKP